MKSLLQLSSGLLTKQHQLLLTVTGGTQDGSLAELIAVMALQGPFSIVVGSERLPSYEVTRLLSYETTEIKAILDRIHLARAFTLYQLVDLLNTTPSVSEPLLVVDFLHSFYDEDTSLIVRKRILEQCVAMLATLSVSRSIGVVVQYMQGLDYPEFFPVVASVADQVFEVKLQEGKVSQPSLF